MSSTQQGQGEVYVNSVTRLLDTRHMEWEDWFQGTKVKVLDRFDGGEPSVYLLWLPPGTSQEPHRHFHERAGEFHFVLEGQQPTWVYDSADQGVGEGHNIVLREGYYLGRHPGSEGIHGRETTAGSPTGCVMLCWRTSTGTMLAEPNASEETTVVPYPQSGRSAADRRTGQTKEG